MATLTIENVPDKLIKNLWTTVSFENVKIIKRKDPTIRLQRLMDDPENISYWPFEWEEINNYLKNLMK